MQGEVYDIIDKHLKTPAASYNLNYVKMSHGLLEEYNQAMVADVSSTKYFNYQVLVSKLPSIFKQVYVDSNLLSGIIVGGEAGIEVSSMSSLELNVNLFRSAIDIVTACNAIIIIATCSAMQPQWSTDDSCGTFDVLKV